MELVDKILLVLKNSKKPLKAKQIAYIINLKYKTEETRNSINSLLYSDMKNIVEEEDFKWRLKNISKNNSITKSLQDNPNTLSYHSNKIKLLLNEFKKVSKEFNRKVDLFNENDKSITLKQVQEFRTVVKNHKKNISVFLNANYYHINSNIINEIEKELPELLNAFKKKYKTKSMLSDNKNILSEKLSTDDKKIILSSKIDEYISAFKKGRARKGFDEIHDNLIKFLISESIDIHGFIDYVLKTNLLYYRTNRHKLILNILDDKRIQYLIITKNLSTYDKKINLNETDEISSCIKEMNYSYYIYKYFVKYGNKYDYISNKFNNRYKKSFEKCNKIITDSNLNLHQLKNIINEYSFSKIESSELTTEWIVKKIENKTIDDEQKAERKEEYKIFCDQFWSDGVITQEEEDRLIELRKKLNLNEKEASLIFKTSKADYLKCNKNWKINFKKEMDSSVDINYDKKLIQLNTSKKNKEEIMSEFIRKVFTFRNNHRSLELDLFFENLEEYYDKE